MVAALVVLLLSGLRPPDLTGPVSALLAPLGLSAEAVEAAVALAAGTALYRGSGGPAVGHLARTASPRRAAYLLAAARRLQDATGEGPAAFEAAARAERRYLSQHLVAESVRAEAAARVDRAATVFGPVLGWVSRQDRRVTLECYRAHGRNFSALRPPAIGWPGTLHAGACRCVPGPPWPGGTMLT